MKNQGKPWQDCEDYEIGGGDLVPSGFKKPVTLENISGLVLGLFAMVCTGAFVGFVGWIVLCVVKRIFN